MTANRGKWAIQPPLSETGSQLTLSSSSESFSAVPSEAGGPETGVCRGLRVGRDGETRRRLRKPALLASFLCWALMQSHFGKVQTRVCSNGAHAGGGRHGRIRPEIGSTLRGVCAARSSRSADRVRSDASQRALRV